MQVLVDVSAVPRDPVGAGKYTVELVAALHRTGELELTLLTRRDDAERWGILAPEATVHAVAPTNRPARLVWEQVWAPRFATELGIDVWHGPHYTRPLRANVPSVVTLHDMTFFDHPEWHECTKVAYFQRVIPPSVRDAAAIIAVSAFTASGIRRRFDPTAPVYVAPHGVDHDRFRTDAAADEADRLRAIGVRSPYLAFVGLLEPRKDVPALVRAFTRISAERPNLRLVLAGGDGWGARAVRDAVASSGVASRILRPGYIPADTVPVLLRNAEIVAYPSLTEGFGLPALEALACGAALVSTSGSAVEEVVGDAALLVPPGDVDALAAALDWLLADPHARIDLALRGPARAAEFTWDASAAIHLEAYRHAAGRPAETGA
jgi:glycosyltransferase involved in cell wall biosynthesis